MWNRFCSKFVLKKISVWINSVFDTDKINKKTAVIWILFVNLYKSFSVWIRNTFFKYRWDYEMEDRKKVRVPEGVNDYGYTVWKTVGKEGIVLGDWSECQGRSWF